MSFLHQKSQHARHVLALGVAVGIGAVLVIVMIWVYTRPQQGRDTDANKQIADFYTTILGSAQSYFGSKE